MKKDVVKVLVQDEKGTLFESEAFAISSTNDQGPFDILPEHSNFITLISEKLIIHLKNGEKKEFPVTNGVLRCLADETCEIQVYLGV